jgi:hypothetical protein
VSARNRAVDAATGRDDARHQYPNRRRPAGSGCVALGQSRRHPAGPRERCARHGARHRDVRSRARRARQWHPHAGRRRRSRSAARESGASAPGTRGHRRRQQSAADRKRHPGRAGAAESADARRRGRALRSAHRRDHRGVGDDRHEPRPAGDRGRRGAGMGAGGPRGGTAGQRHLCKASRSGPASAA